MNKAISKWPSRALNLLVVLSMVIALCAVLAPAVAVQAACPDDRTERHDGACYLEVFVNTYTKDATGNFIAAKQINAGTTEEPSCFYVNAVVVNTGNETAGNETDPCNYHAKLEISPSYAYTDEPEEKTAVEPIAQLGNVHMQEFWWKVCCTQAGNTTITVEAWSDTCVYKCNDGNHVYGSTIVEQIVPPEDKCLKIEIIEAPGLGLNNPIPQMISTSTDFGIKARITNTCDVTISEVNATISWTPGALANIIPVNNPPMYQDPVDPWGWSIGDLAPGEDEIVGWTLHCNGEGEVQVKVNATGKYDGGNKESLDPYTDFINDPWKVIQQERGSLKVTIDEPMDDAKIPAKGCSDGTFLIKATVENTGDTAVNSVWVLASVNNAYVSIDYPTELGPYSIAGGGHVHGEWTAICENVGDTEIKVEASGQVLGGGSATGNDTVDIHQKSLITDFVGFYRTDMTPLVDPDKPYGVEGNVYDGQVNICQDYYVVFSISNYTTSSWIDAQLCIWWDGPGTMLIGDTYWRKYPIGTPPADRGTWTLLDDSPSEVDAGNGWFYECQSPLLVCDCCTTEVRWEFKCANPDDVTFYAVGTKSLLTDTSREALVKQEYKAHLIGGLFTFLQDEDKFMQPRNAFAPCQQFHVVYPVVNTGDATAKDVRVDFKITEVVTDSYDVLGFSGDVGQGNGTFNAATGIGHAHLGDIEGGSAKKMILRVQCKTAGDIRFWYNGLPAISGTDENTNGAIIFDTDIRDTNILHPECSVLVKQIPFEITIENPFEDENFKFSDNYTVKAVISNLSNYVLTNVNATIDIDGPAELVDTVVGGITHPQSNPKLMGDIEAGRLEQITWEIHCNGEGDVTFLVTAVSEDPSLTACSDEVTVHQLPAPSLEVLILSPVAIHTMIATGEPFAVSAMVMNTGGLAAEGVQVAIGDYDEDVEWYRTNATIYLNDECITPGSETIWVDDVEQVRGVDYTIDSYAFGYGTFINIPDEDAVVSASWLDQFSLVDSEMVQDIGTLGPLETKIVTWTLRAETTCAGGCVVDDEPIFVTAWGSNVDYDEAPMVFVDIYPAAHLVTVIGTVTPVVNVCDEFNVSYTVYNIGQADAWNTSVTLSVAPEGSVRIAGGETGYTQMLGTIPGYDSGALEVRGNATGTFKLHCKMACESTITITPAGYDECGIHFVDPGVGIKAGPGGGPSFLGYVEQPGRAIEQKFLEPASKTVKQVVSGGVDLSIDKTADNLFPASEQPVKFTVVVTNNGPADATGIVVSDAIPTGLLMSNHIQTQGTYALGMWTVGSLNAGSSATLVINCIRQSTPPGEIKNTATITALGQVDPFSDNNTSSVILNKAEITSWPITLKPGWNLISLPLMPTSSAIGTVINLIHTHVIMVWAYDPVLYPATAGWASYDPLDIPASNLTIMKDGPGYWINMDTSATSYTLTILGKVNPTPPGKPPTYEVHVGWNLIGFKSTYDQTAMDYLAGITGQYTKIWGYANGQYHPVSTSGTLNPGFGYWIAVTVVPGTIYP